MRKAGPRCPFPSTLCVDMGSCVSKQLHGYCSWKDTGLWWLLPLLSGLKPGLSHELLGQIPDFSHLVVAFFPCCYLQRCQAVSQSGGNAYRPTHQPSTWPCKRAPVLLRWFGRGHTLAFYAICCVLLTLIPKLRLKSEGNYMLEDFDSFSRACPHLDILGATFT